MTVVVVPFHQDEKLADDLIPLPSGGDYLVLSPTLPDGEIWQRLTALYNGAALQIAAVIAGSALDPNDAIWDIDGLREFGEADIGLIPRSAAARPTPAVISGDCLVSLATLAGAQRAGVDPALIWFDAHGDVHTLETTTSGYLGGLSLRLALGAHADRLAPLGLRPIPEDRTVLVDARDLDPAEAEYLASSAIRRTTLADLDTATLPDGPLILHIDLDVIDPADLPGLLFPAPNGPSTSEVLAAVRKVLDTGRVTALDIACPWHPAPNGRTQQARADLIAALLPKP